VATNGWSKRQQGRSTQGTASNTTRRLVSMAE
jgi:hypothetical protein